MIDLLSYIFGFISGFLFAVLIAYIYINRQLKRFKKFFEDLGDIGNILKELKSYIEERKK